MEASAFDQATTPLAKVDQPRRLRWIALLVPIGLLALLGLGGAGYVRYHADRILPGVRAAGVELGSLTEGEAVAALEGRLNSYLDTPLTLVAGEQRWQTPVRALGVSYDAAATVQEAMALGRRGSGRERLLAWLPAGRPPYELQPAGRLDQVGLLRGLTPALQTLNFAPTDAAIVIQPASGLTITPAQEGQTVDLATATQALQERALRLSTEPMTLRLLPVTPAIREQALSPVKAAADDLLRQPFGLELSSEDDRRLAPQTPRRWAIPPENLSAMLTLGGADRQTLALDEGRLAAFLERIGGELAQPSQDATLSMANAVVTLKPHIDGLALDIPATSRQINEAIAQRRYAVTLATRVEAPAVLTADLEPARDEIDRLLERPFKLSAGDLNRTLGRKELAGFLSIEARPTADLKAGLIADRGVLGDYLAQLARQVDREPRSPAFKFVNGKVTRTAEPVQGRRLETAAAVDALAQALVDPALSELKLPVKLIDAPLADLNPSDIVIRDVLATGVTAYGFSLPERKHNVELATSRLNGTLIPPGELFSFNRAVGRVSTASGYQTGYGIVLTNGAVTTVPSVGGGICQVATTVFHAAFRSGMPIGERNWHFYWIPTYGQAPSGLTGLDATVDEDYGLDFTFRNTTGNWIAVETSYDGQNIRISLRGVNPGWEVRIGTPAINNVKPHDPKPVERPDPSLAPGKRIQVETARDGMDVAIARTVLRGGQVIDQRTFNSHYEPSQNVTLVGPAKPEGQ